MTSKKDKGDQENEPILATGASGDPENPGAVKPVGYATVPEPTDQPTTENRVSGKDSDSDKESSK